MSEIANLLQQLTAAHNAIPAEDWARTPPSVRAYVTICHELIKALSGVLPRLEQRVAELEQENAWLKERINTNSGNSSLPPSAEIGSKRPKIPKGKSGRRRGAQPGHPGHSRRLAAVEECRQVVDLRPPVCGNCGLALHGEDPKPQRHQVVEIPPPRVEVDEYRLHELTCAGCGARTRAKLPDDVSASGYGAGVAARVALLSGVYRASERMVQEALNDLFGVELSLGTVNRLRLEASQAVAAPVAAAHEYVKNQPLVQPDETGFRQGNADGQNPTGKKAWLWVAVTPLVTVFLVCLSRGQDAARKLLGGSDFAGKLVSDRWNGYNWVKLAARQLCWAHLKRDFQKIAERSGESGRLGRRLLDLEGELFGLWHRVRDGTLAWRELRGPAELIRAQIKALLEEGAAYQPKAKEKSLRAATARTCRNLLEFEAAMWLFVYEAGVPPTNNAAEKAIRPAVLWRNVSFGTQSAEGSRFVARMLTVVTTLRSQQRNVLTFLVEACQALRHDHRTPSLLPADFTDQPSASV